MLRTLTYRLAVAAATPMASLVLRRPAAREGHRGRRAAAAALEAWARTGRDLKRPLVWVHAASVGEGLQARAVLAALRARRPDVQAVVTRFSASAERLAASMPAEFTSYIPYDRRDEMSRVLSALDPLLLVFAKLDVWPELASAAAARGTKVALVAGSVDPASARLTWPARALAARGYAALDLAAAIAPEDGARLVRLGADASRVVVTGDPRVDSVLDAIAQHRATTPDEASPSPSLLVAGSTWPPDEALLLDALVSIRQHRPDARLLVAPHEPTAPHLERLERAAVDLGLAPTRWGSRGDATAPLAIVDRVGVLASLYRDGAVAYVGGGWGERGIHSVLEPAGWQRPVIIGPNDRGVRDARLLAAAGGLVRLPTDRALPALVEQWRRWLDEPAAAERAGLAAGTALEADRGAAVRSAALLETLLP